MTYEEYKTQLAHALHDSPYFGSCFYAALSEINDWWWVRDAYKAGVSVDTIVEEWAIEQVKIRNARQEFYGFVTTFAEV